LVSKFFFAFVERHQGEVSNIGMATNEILHSFFGCGWGGNKDKVLARLRGEGFGNEAQKEIKAASTQAAALNVLRQAGRQSKVTQNSPSLPKIKDGQKNIVKCNNTEN